MHKRSLPSLPVKFTLEEAAELIQDELDENNWGEIEVPTPELELVPYYVFQYDSYSEVEEEGTKIRNVDEAKQGSSSINAATNQLDDVIAEICPPELIQSEFIDPKDVKVNVKEPRFTMDEAKGSAQIKIAAHEKVPRANVHISGLRLVYFPFWQYKVELDEENTLKIRINGITGEFENEESGIPYQGKTKTELLHETVSDLQNPGGWGEYLSNFIKDIFLLLRPSQEHPNRWLMIFILILIALFLLGLGFIKLPA